MSSTINRGFSEPQGDPALLSVIVVSWKVRDYVQACLTSLADARIFDWASVIVIDNASDDGTQEMVEREFPGVRFIQTGQNLGFSRPNNRGIRESSSKYVLLLNPDTVVHDGSLERLVAEMEANPDIGAVGPRQESADGVVHFEGGVNLPTVWNAFCDLALLAKMFPRSRVFNRRYMGWWDHRDERDVPGIAGSALMLRRSALDQIGLLDESMFCAEDMDLCRRLASAGWRVRYVGSVGIVHHGGGSVKRSDRLGWHRQIAYQSFWLYLRKHDGALVAAAMATSVGAWSAVCWVGVNVLSLLLKFRERPLDRLSRSKTIFEALFQWSICNKLQFEHSLAAAPLAGTTARRP